MNKPSAFHGSSSIDLWKKIERYAYHTWPATTEVPYGDWFMRASGGITKRANSVWTAAGQQPPGGDWMKEVEQFYHSHGLPACYHISDASPKGIDTILEAAGYHKLFPCHILVSDIEQVIHLSSCEPGILAVRLQDSSDESWLEDFLQLEEFALEKYAFYEALFSRITHLKCFCSLILDGQCVAVGSAVVENGWAGLTNIVVKPGLRGRGIGKLLIHSLAEWGHNNGAQQIYLQVLDNNQAALRLYEKTGFTPLFRYHYRIEME
jgi:GNAT superfamily N-acetyltransferase